MTFQYPSSGLSNTAEYMASGLPWVSSSAIPSGSTWKIELPFVSNHLTVQNVGTAASSLGIGFSLSGSQGSNKFILASNATFQNQFSHHIRVTTIYITAITANVTASVFAGLTTILPRNYPTLTGSSPVPFDMTGSVYENYLSYTGIG